MMTRLLFLAALIAACRPESTTPRAIVVDSFGVVWPGLLPPRGHAVEPFRIVLWRGSLAAAKAPTVRQQDHPPGRTNARWFDQISANPCQAASSLPLGSLWRTGWRGAQRHCYSGRVRLGGSGRLPAGTHPSLRNRGDRLGAASAGALGMVDRARLRGVLARRRCPHRPCDRTRRCVLVAAGWLPELSRRFLALSRPGGSLTPLALRPGGIPPACSLTRLKQHSGVASINHKDALDEAR